MNPYKRSIEELFSRRQIADRHGLPELRAYLKALGNPQDSFKSVHVTGTNGKGSVCALVAQTLRCAGYRTGLFISPHLVDVRERIQIDGKPISPRELMTLMAEVSRGSRLNLTFFETLTLAAFVYFARRGVDYAVIEVGIGGRLDVTNIIARPEVSVITSVGLDHVGLLGDSVEKIAFEKAGIIKRGAPCVCGKLPPSALAVVKKQAAAMGSKLRFPSGERVFHAAGTDWRGRKLLLSSGGNATLRLNLLGDYQAANASVAAEAVAALNDAGARISRSALKKAFRIADWRGRFQVVRRGSRTVVLDGGHNPDAAAVFSREFAKSPFAEKKVTFVLGLLKDKDCIAIVRALRPHLGRVIVTAPASARALDTEELSALVLSVRPDAEILVQRDAARALKAALRAPVCVVAGSFYLVGVALRLLGAMKKTELKC